MWKLSEKSLYDKLKKYFSPNFSIFSDFLTFKMNNSNLFWCKIIISDPPPNLLTMATVYWNSSLKKIISDKFTPTMLNYYHFVICHFSSVVILSSKWKDICEKKTAGYILSRLSPGIYESRNILEGIHNQSGENNSQSQLQVFL